MIKNQYMTMAITLRVINFWLSSSSSSLEQKTKKEINTTLTSMFSHMQIVGFLMMRLILEGL